MPFMMFAFFALLIRNFLDEIDAFACELSRNDAIGYADIISAIYISFGRNNRTVRDRMRNITHPLRDFNHPICCGT
jgi:hypothetical protein